MLWQVAIVQNTHPIGFHTKLPLLLVVVVPTFPASSHIKDKTHDFCVSNRNIFDILAVILDSTRFKINISIDLAVNRDRMHHPASFTSTPGVIGNYARNMTQSGKVDVDIVVDNHEDGTVYTTFDSISGQVNITAAHAFRFDEIRITFEGSTRTYVENLSPHSTKSRTTAFHSFLKLTMPIRDSEYPQPRIADAGRTYSFSFNFAVPEQLLPQACTHKCSADHIHHAHLQLPPTLGGAMGATDYSVYDDMGPDMSKIKYVIKARVMRSKDSDEKEVVLAEEMKKVCVVPKVAEAPPMRTEFGDDYVLSKTKSLRKGMFSGKLGRITVSAAQPRAITLPSPSPSPTKLPATTMATVDLRFDPHEASSEPPRLGGLTTKIKSVTFFSARPAQEFPTRASMSSSIESSRGVYKCTVPVSSRCVERVAWKKHTAPQRRNSDSSTCSSDCSDSASDERPYYTATILVPISLPSYKRWVPTFHSCIVSRVYAIDLTLTIHTPGTGVPASSVSLHLPVQIAASGNRTGLTALTAAEAHLELQEANEFFTPRFIYVPREEHVGNSVLAFGSSELPPRYEDFSQAIPVVEPGRS